MKRILTREEKEAIQQPLDKDGYSNDYFTKLYGKDKNPYVGTERDRANRKINVYSSPSEAYRKGWEIALGHPKKK